MLFKVQVKFWLLLLLVHRRVPSLKEKYIPLSLVSHHGPRYVRVM